MDGIRKGRPWSLPLEESAADRIIDYLGPTLALKPSLRDCRLKGEGVRQAMLGIACRPNLTLTG